MRHIVVLGLPGALASFVSSPMDVFSMVGVLWNQIAGKAPKPMFRVEVVSQDGHTIPCANGATLGAHRSIDGVAQADLVIVSSAGPEVESILSSHGRAVRWLRRLHARGAMVASACTGAFLLAETGLLDGRRATTHWGFAERFRKRYPKVRLRPELTVVDEGDVVSAGGAESVLWLCLHLVERWLGYEIALQTARSLLLDLQPTPQRAFAALEARRDHGDGPILAAQDRLEQNFAQTITLQTLAAQVAMSPRNLHRRFTTATGETPTTYLQRVRVEAAKRALATTRNGVAQIAYGVGYSDEGFFRRLFRRVTGVSPGAYRRSFQRAPTPRARTPSRRKSEAGQPTST